MGRADLLELTFSSVKGCFTSVFGPIRGLPGEVGYVLAHNAPCEFVLGKLGNLLCATKDMVTSVLSTYNMSSLWLRKKGMGGGGGGIVSDLCDVAAPKRWSTLSCLPTCHLFGCAGGGFGWIAPSAISRHGPRKIAGQSPARRPVATKIRGDSGHLHDAERVSAEAAVIRAIHIMI